MRICALNLYQITANFDISNYKNMPKFENHISAILTCKRGHFRGNVYVIWVEILCWAQICFHNFNSNQIELDIMDFVSCISLSWPWESPIFSVPNHHHSLALPQTSVSTSLIHIWHQTLLVHLILMVQIWLPLVSLMVIWVIIFYLMDSTSLLGSHIHQLSSNILCQFLSKQPLGLGMTVSPLLWCLLLIMDSLSSQ